MRAQVNVSGKPGLIFIPSAKVLDDGTFSVGVTHVPIHYSFRFNTRNSENIYFVNLALLPRLEINFNLLRPNGPIRFQDRGIGDRQLDVKYSFLTEKVLRPSIALILSAPFGIDQSLVTYALAATKNVRLTETLTAEITAGYSSPYYVYRDDKDLNFGSVNIFSDYKIRNKRDRPYYYLAGPFGGININYKRKGGIMAEWDSQHLNVGVYVTLFKDWTVQAGLLNGDQVTLGTSYTFSLLRLPKRLTTPDEAN
ncbi:hypothetical protein GCM10023189_32090 [Nibrella saemangeumensis]|uniref:Uncharacterized protein n=1 Tax=Nibrella saemangeumensis TaxID=1084526 RepID=A0ABP8N2K6_9BACT